MVVYALAFVCTLLTSTAVLASDHFKLEYNNQIYHLINVTGPKATCQTEPLVQAADSNQDEYITADLRYALCEKSFEDVGKTFSTVFNKEVCFADAGHLESNNNPCYVVCAEKSLTNNTNGNTDCDSKDPGAIEFLLTDFQCGQNQFCDKNGCCVEKEKEDVITTPTPTESPTTPTTTTKTPMTPETPATPEAPTTIETPTTTETPTPTDSPTIPTTTTETPRTPETPATPETPTTTETPTPTPTPTVEPTPAPKPRPSKRHICSHTGYSLFTPNPRYYFFCKFYATIHSCGTDKKFNSAQSNCQYDPTTPDPALPFSKWRNAITCPKYGTYIRSPYNCKYFYTCVSDGLHDKSIYFNYCNRGLVFNETSQSCDFKTKRCNNRMTVP